MAKNTSQVSKSFIIAGIIITSLYLLLDFAGILLLADNKANLDQNNILKYVLDNYISTGFKGLLIVGIVAMIMSTADSYINSSAVLFSYDFFQSLGINLPKQQQLLLVRVSSLFIGICAFFLSFFAKNLFDIILSSYSFFMPVVSVPLILAIFGFRSTSKSVLIGMFAGFITVLYFKMFSEIDSIIPGMIANLVFFFGSHYLLRQTGGWIRIKEVEVIRAERKKKIAVFIYSIKSFNFIEYCKQSLPKEERIQVYFGVFCIVSLFSNLYSLPKALLDYHINLIYVICYSTLILSTIFITYSFWTKKFRNESFRSVIWFIAIFYNLAFVGSLFVIISKFNSMQITIFMVNLITISVLVNWQGALVTIFSGAITSLCFLSYYTGQELVPEEVSTMHSMQVKVTYLLLLVSSVLIAFLKPKQEKQRVTEMKLDYLDNKLTDQKKEITQSQELKHEFLRNIQHEIRTPIVGITSLGQALADNYDQLTEEQRKYAAKQIGESSERLNSLVSNILDLSKLSSLKYDLKFEEVDLSNLVYERAELCKKLYVQDANKDLQEFIFDIEDGIYVNCDKYYIGRTIDNIIINAIQYCREGKVTIKLKQLEDQKMEFSVTDEGIGIPQEELNDIFGAFVVSSKTRTIAGGRGVGLALAWKVIELHNGRIWAESDGSKGAKIVFVLPL